MTKIGAVIVSYNSGSEIKKCISSFLSQKLNNAELIVCVVDNASTDKSAAIAKKIKSTYVIKNKQNKGFSAAVNQGIEYLINNDAEYILILNPDAMMQAQSLGPLYKRFISKESIGAVGPMMLHGDGSDATDGYYLKAPSALTVITFSTFLRPYALKQNWLMKRYQEKLGRDAAKVEQVPGACLFTSKNIIEKIGRLDEDFAIWFEDVEWSYRARKKGYELWYEPDSRVIHEGGVSFAKWNDINKAVTFYVSMKTFFRKWKPISYVFVVGAITINSLALYAKSRDKSNLVFLKKFLRQKRGVLPG